METDIVNDISPQEDEEWCSVLPEGSSRVVRGAGSESDEERGERTTESFTVWSSSHSDHSIASTTDALSGRQTQSHPINTPTKLSYRGRGVSSNNNINSNSDTRGREGSDPLPPNWCAVAEGRIESSESFGRNNVSPREGDWICACRIASATVCNNCNNPPPLPPILVQTFPSLYPDKIFPVQTFPSLYPEVHLNFQGSDKISLYPDKIFPVQTFPPLYPHKIFSHAHHSEGVDNDHHHQYSFPSPMVGSWERFERERFYRDRERERFEPERFYQDREGERHSDHYHRPPRSLSPPFHHRRTVGMGDKSACVKWHKFIMACCTRLSLDTLSKPEHFSRICHFTKKNHYFLHMGRQQTKRLIDLLQKQPDRVRLEEMTEEMFVVRDDERVGGAEESFDEYGFHYVTGIPGTGKTTSLGAAVVYLYGQYAEAREKLKKEEVEADNQKREKLKKDNQKLASRRILLLEGAAFSDNPGLELSMALMQSYSDTPSALEMIEACSGNPTHLIDFAENRAVMLGESITIVVDDGNKLKQHYGGPSQGSLLVLQNSLLCVYLL